MCGWDLLPPESRNGMVDAIEDGESASSRTGHVAESHSGCGGTDVGNRLSRRFFLAAAAGVTGGLMLSPKAFAERVGRARANASQVGADWRGMSAVLLGTGGGPIPMQGRNETSQAVVVNGSAYLIDCGSGVVRQLVDAGVPYGTIKALFITHLHADHVNDYFAATMSGRPIGPQPGFAGPVHVYGPGRAGALPPGALMPGVEPVNPSNPTTGTVDLHDRILEAFAYTTNIMYIKSPSGPDIRELVLAHDIEVPNVGASPTGPLAPSMDPFPVYEDENVRVSATLVPHGTGPASPFPSFGYRFDSEYGSIVFSGDTKPSENVVKLAKGADLLVHEVMYTQAMLDAGFPESFAKFIRSVHTDVTEVGSVANQAEVGELALSHVVPIDPRTPYGPTLPDQQWVKPIRQDYDGPITMGQDLMRLPIGDRRGHRRRGPRTVYTPAAR